MLETFISSRHVCSLRGRFTNSSANFILWNPVARLQNGPPGLYFTKSSRFEVASYPATIRRGYVVCNVIFHGRIAPSIQEQWCWRIAKRIFGCIYLWSPLGVCISICFQTSNVVLGKTGEHATTTPPHRLLCYSHDAIFVFYFAVFWGSSVRVSGNLAGPLN